MKTLTPLKRSRTSKKKIVQARRKKTSAEEGRYVTIYLSGALASHYQNKARELHTTIGKLLKERIETKPVTVFDRMKKFAGSAGEGPVDLSTNPIYFEGFGEDIQPAKFKK